MSPASARIALFAGLVLVSTSAPILRMASMDAVAVVFFRMAICTVLFLGWALLRRRSVDVPETERRKVALGGVLLAAHFLLWVKAFDLTDYASNLILLVAQPVMAALLGRYAGERTTSRMWVSVGLAFVGLAIVTGGDVSLGPRALLGDLLCILAGLAISLFYLVTRSSRSCMRMDVFMGWTLAAGTVAALPVVLLTNPNLVGYPPATWGWLAALVVLTTMGGHGLMNLAARGLPLFTINIVIVLEPPIGLLLGAPFFPVQVRAAQVAGGLLLAASVFVALRTSAVEGPTAASGPPVQ